MRYLFVSHYIDLLFKKRQRSLQFFLAFSFTALPFIYIADLTDFLIGKPIQYSQLFPLLSLIYTVLNFIYSFSNKIVKNGKVAIKEPKYVALKNNPDRPKERKEVELSVLSSKNYTKGKSIKTSPRRLITKEEEKAVLVSENLTSENKSESNLNHTELEPPPLEINLESTKEFIQKESAELEAEYSGVIDENFDPSQLDIQDADDLQNTIESLLPDANNALFDNVQKKKFI